VGVAARTDLSRERDYKELLCDKALCLEENLTREFTNLPWNQ